MIDIKFLRENPDVVKENIKKKFQDEKLPLVDEVIELTKSDKKADSDKISFILLKKLGKAVIDTTVTDDEMKAALNEILYVETND